MSRACKHGNGLALKRCFYSGRLQASTSNPAHTRSIKSISRDETRFDEQLRGMQEDALRDQLELSNTADSLRRIFLGPKSLQRSRANLQRLEANQTRPGDWTSTIDRPNVFKRLRHFEDNDSSSSVVLSLDLLRFQYRACSMAEDYVLVYTTALRHDESAQLIASRSMQNMLRSSLESLLTKPRTQHKGDDIVVRVLMAVDLFIRRIQSMGFQVELSLLLLGLKTAAVCRSLSGIKRYLKLWQEFNITMRQDFHKAVPIEFFTDLVKNLESKEPKLMFVSDERCRKAVLEIMCGFSDASSAEPYHLGIYLPRDSVPAMTQWLAVLAIWKGSTQIWNEWLHLKSYRARGQRRSYAPTSTTVRGSSDEFSRLFIINLFRAGDPIHAWRVFEAEAEHIRDDDDRVWELLFLHADSITLLGQRLHQRVRDKFLLKLEKRLCALENKLGYKWIAPGEGCQAYHALVQDQTVDLDGTSEPQILSQKSASNLSQLPEPLDDDD